MSNSLAKDSDNAGVLVIYVQQAAAAKTIGILVKLSTQIAELFLSVRSVFCWKKNVDSFILNFIFKLQVVHNLLFTMGNEEYADSQRQASKTLEVIRS